MAQQQYDFYLGSREYGDDWRVPRSCKLIARPVGPHGEEYLLIEVTPPVIGQRHGLGGNDISHLVISPHHEGDSLSDRPVDVYVYRILSRSMLETGKFTNKDVEMVAWGEIYATLEEAQQACNMPR